MRPPSVIQPLAPTIERSRRLLFAPFLLSKWLRLGFCAFLAGATPAAGFGGTGSGFQLNDSGDDRNDGGGFTNPFPTVLPWIQEHQAVILAVVAILGLVLLTLGLVLTWLSSRAQFMLLDGVVRNRAAIGAPWREYRREGNSLFRFRFGFGLVSLLALAVIVALIVVVGEADLRAGLWGARLVLLALCGTVAMLTWFGAVWLVGMLLMDFVVPVMYLHRLPVWKAWSFVYRDLVLAHPGSVALYVLARVLLNVVVGTLASLATLLTCCLALVPYLGAVLLLPFTVVQLTYPLVFLEQLGPEWQFFPPDRPPPPPPPLPA